MLAQVLRQENLSSLFSSCNDILRCTAECISVDNLSEAVNEGNKKKSILERFPFYCGHYNHFKTLRTVSACLFKVHIFLNLLTYGTEIVLENKERKYKAILRLH